MPEDDEKPLVEQPEDSIEEKPTLVSRLTGLAENAVKIVSGAKDVSVAIGKAFLNSPEQLKRMEEAGRYLQDVRELAGLTRKELSEAIELADESLLGAVEEGTAVLSFELILRIAALLARHDPMPFVFRFIRSYNPEVWALLENWGFDKIPLHFERERKFVNIYRSHDVARELSDEGFEKILAHTNSSFELALHFIIEQEGIKPKKSKLNDETDE